MQAADLDRLRREAEAAWIETSHAEARRLLAEQDGAVRARAYAVLLKQLAASGDALLPEDEHRIQQSFASAAPRPPQAPWPEGAGDDPGRCAALALEAALQSQRRLAAWLFDLAGGVGLSLGIPDARHRLEAAMAAFELADPQLRGVASLRRIHAQLRATQAVMQELLRLRQGPERGP
ncbi:hypothetical protein [Roseomonas sp. USHLN139]|uniref:hypothetical protein n=1 Tax=Roseomonas sp. USHLN139 TaxID=3081298 RepID=UPI003B01F5F8